MHILYEKSVVFQLNKKEVTYMRLILAALFWFLFWKGIQEDKPLFLWGGLVMGVIMLVWELFVVWIDVSSVFVWF